MLAALVGAQAAAGLVLRGAWDLWSQSLVLLLALIGTAAGAAWSLSVSGRLRLPPSGAAAWAAGLAAVSWLSALWSPVAAYSLPVWAACAAGLWLVPAAAMLSETERVRAEQILRVAGWALVLGAVAQRWGGDPRPASLLVNQNVLAGAALLLLPLAARRGDLLLSGGLLLCLWWARSVGAWLGLSAALLLDRRTWGTFFSWAGAGVGLAAAAAVFIKLRSPEALHRWAWWAAAWRMSAAAPWLGLGPGSYAYALPAHAAIRPELWTLFAHEHFLETAAERGWPYALAWVVGLALILRRAEPGRRFGPFAALVQGLVDYPLSVPGVFGLFCFSVGLALPPSGRTVSLRSGGARAALGACLLALAACGSRWAADNWRADHLRAEAIAELRAGSGLEEPRRLLAASEALRPHPEAARLRAEIALARAKGPGPGASALVERAARDLERAVSLDPYRASNWRLLEDAYRRLGRPEDAARARARGARTCPSLRAAA